MVHTECHVLARKGNGTNRITCAQCRHTTCAALQPIGDKDGLSAASQNCAPSAAADLHRSESQFEEYTYTEWTIVQLMVDYQPCFG